MSVPLGWICGFLDTQILRTLALDGSFCPLIFVFILHIGHSNRRQKDPFKRGSTVYESCHRRPVDTSLNQWWDAHGGTSSDNP